ncbi:TauD/TfdA family dioxygenase [Leptospira wolffii]|uniref:TauD/TfdA family dioxygenase n=1 Tax=Leptospira wolffii TaxID=409998 RepID=UPI001AF021CE|nr:TauD/TfdA family dioxygenase [Leptospira wolffii]
MPTLTQKKRKPISAAKPKSLRGASSKSGKSKPEPVEKSFFPGNSLPIVYRPKDQKARENGFLPAWVKANRKEVNRDLLIYGAVLFRGFDVKTPQDFEDVALAADPNLKNEYLGTSPRDRITKFVHTASELPGAYPIMQHAEMSFLDKPPRKLFFFAKQAPEKFGETPIADLRKIYSDLDPEIRDKFETKGVRYLRKYDGPKASRFSLWKTKRWNEMFSTSDKKEVEKKSAEQRFQVEWLKEDGLKLTNVQVGIRKHPIAKTVAWHNHSQTFHVDTPALEYWKILKRQKTLRGLGVAVTLSLLTLWTKLTRKSEDLDVHATYGDGSPITSKEIGKVVDTFWKNLSVFSWKTGDILLIDNYSASHGRHPFSGPREILVAWTD